MSARSAAKPAARGADDIAHGPGPAWWRYVLVGLAAVYFFAITVIDHGRKIHLPAALAFFTTETQLFADADRYVNEFHVDAWSCDRDAWEPLDPRPDFPIHASDKESRFQRVLSFYDNSPGKKGKWLLPVVHALERYLIERHAEGADDGVAGPIGGVRIVRLFVDFGWPGDDVPRYQYRPLAPLPAGVHQEDVFTTPPRHARRQCAAGGHAIDYAPPGAEDE